MSTGTGSGTLVIGAMTGTRDEHNHIPTIPALGRGLSELCGVRVEEFGRVAEPGADGLFGLHGTEFRLHKAAAPRPASSAARRYKFVLGNGEHEAAHLYELLDVDADVKVLGRWSSRFASGRAAITIRKVGEGSAVYMGTYLTGTLVENLADERFGRIGIAPLIADLPANVEVTLRHAADRKLLFVLNTDEDTVEISSLPAGMDVSPTRR